MYHDYTFQGLDGTGPTFTVREAEMGQAYVRATVALGRPDLILVDPYPSAAFHKSSPKTVSTMPGLDTFGPPKPQPITQSSPFWTDRDRYLNRALLKAEIHGEKGRIALEREAREAKRQQA